MPLSCVNFLGAILGDIPDKTICACYTMHACLRSTAGEFRCGSKVQLCSVHIDTTRREVIYRRGGWGWGGEALGRPLDTCGRHPSSSFSCCIGRHRLRLAEHGACLAGIRDGQTW